MSPCDACMSRSDSGVPDRRRARSVISASAADADARESENSPKAVRKQGVCFRGLYDAYGHVLSGDMSLTRYLFTSRDFDAATGLQYNRARWYDAGVGRWISEDPIGFVGGDPNVARYVGNGVIRREDPSGLVDAIPGQHWWNNGPTDGWNPITWPSRFGHAAGSAAGWIWGWGRNRLFGNEGRMKRELAELREKEAYSQGGFAIADSVRSFNHYDAKEAGEDAGILIQGYGLTCEATIGTAVLSRVTRIPTPRSIPKSPYAHPAHPLHVPAAPKGTADVLRGLDDVPWGQIRRTGCEDVAKRIQGAIGGDIHRIAPRPGRFLGPHRGRPTEWAHHEVVVKDSRVYDALTGPDGLPIDEYKELWEYADDIDFGF